MIRLFSYGPFRPFSYLSSVEYFQYTPSFKVETASKILIIKLGNRFKTASEEKVFYIRYTSMFGTKVFILALKDLLEAFVDRLFKNRLSICMV